MQRFFFRSLLLLLVVASRAAHANHVSGADFFYTHLSDSTYKISLWIYGNCASVPIFNTLNGGAPQVVVKRNGSTVTTLTLAQVGAGVEVTPVCAAEQNNTQCKNVTNTIPGITRYIYEATYTVPTRSANWVFRFDGVLANGASAGRSNTITNINSPGNSVMALEARLNNLNGQINSSPTFTTIPTPFYCINVAQQYNLGANDVNSDSLSFALVPGLVANSGGGGGGSVGYVSSFSAVAPLDVATGAFSFSPVTGQMNFTPQSVQTSLVVQQVNEYRNGVLVGTAMREMNFIVLANCNTNPASNSIDTAKSSTQSGVVISTTDLNVCAGTTNTQFKIIAKNPANNTITATVAGLPAGTSYTVTNNNSTSPVVTVFWNNVTALPTYTFFVTYKDDGCPLTSTQTQAYTVHVYQPNQMTTTIAAPTQCVHKALVNYNFSFGLLPRDISISQAGSVVRSFRDSTGFVADSLGVGLYDVTITSDKLPCPTNLQLRIVDSGLYPNTPLTKPVFYCKFDQSVPLVATPDSGAIIRWYAATGTALGLSPTPRTDTTGIFTWYVDQKYKVCVSKRDSVQVYVTLRPIAAFTGPDKICRNDTAVFTFTGKIGVGPILDYIWNFDGAGFVVGDSAGPVSVHWYDTGLKTVTLRVEENKCPSFLYSQNIFIKPIPYAGFDASNVCQYDTVQVRYNTDPLPGQKYAWNFDSPDMGVATGPGPYYVSWADSGRKHLTLTVDLDGCLDTRFRDITVHPLPEAHIINVPTASLCLGDEVTLLGTGGISYDWVTSDPMLPRSAAAIYEFRILRPETFVLRVKSEHGCVDSDAVSINDVQPCCNFSYPNAFTPNGDGRNDRFRVVTYGNQLEYELSIYNRWGQRVYYGTDPRQGWDGTFAGHLCDAGTYFYYLNAKCYTARQETQKGELELIR